MLINTYSLYCFRTALVCLLFLAFDGYFGLEAHFLCSNHSILLNHLTHHLDLSQAPLFPKRHIMIEALDIPKTKIENFYETNHLPILQIDYSIPMAQIAVAVESMPRHQSH